MSQTLALFHDAYRYLNSRKLFWVVLFISVLLMAGIACVSVKENAIQILWWEIGSADHSFPSSADFYMFVFNLIGIDIWLAWGAALLALISTAGIFPDFLSSGSIEMVLSKPIGRLRLFLTKYITGLLFVSLQVVLFCLTGFLVIGFRGGTWEPRIFIGVPLVVCFFSYLFAACTFFSLVSRSVLMALLLTLVFWLVLYGLDLMDRNLEHRYELYTQGATNNKNVHFIHPTHGRGPGGNDPFAPPGEQARKTSIERMRQMAASTRKTQKLIVGIKTFLPKTSETVDLFKRCLFPLDDLPNYMPSTKRMQLAKKTRSLGWILGTSLGFEVVLLALSGWIFCRRDF